MIGSNGYQGLELARATGTGRNGSGQVLIVTDHVTDRSWVLTGDAGYDLIPHATPADIAALVVPHHGANMGPSSDASVYARFPSSYARLIYSFGPGNGHGSKKPPVRHPVAAALSAHKAWNHGLWTSASPGVLTAGGDVLATASHPATHLDGAAAGWRTAPSLHPGTTTLGHLKSCPNVMPVSQS